MIELGECFLEKKLHTKDATVNPDLGFCIPALELVLHMEFCVIIPFAFEQEIRLFLIVACHLGGAKEWFLLGVSALGGRAVITVLYLTQKRDE